MAKAIFVTGWLNGAPDLLPMDSESGQKLSYTENGERKGGYSVISGQHESTCVVAVHSSQTVIDAMKNDSKYLFVEDILDAPTI